MKLKYVTFISQHQAEQIDPRPDMALISITEPASYEELIPKLDPNWKHLLKVSFHDIDTDRRKQRILAEADEYVIFSEKHATQILEFVEQIKNEVVSLVVHCYAGLSRSAAVALFLSEAYKLNMAPGKSKIYNRTVHRILFNAYYQPRLARRKYEKPRVGKNDPLTDITF